jgi:hypothetical protein
MIADALAADPSVDADTIAVTCFDDGRVALRGSAESPAEATHALRTAYKVAGVRTVDEQLPRSPRWPAGAWSSMSRTRSVWWGDSASLSGSSCSQTAT